MLNWILLSVYSMTSLINRGKLLFFFNFCEVYTYDIWQYVKPYVRAQMLISVLLRMQKEENVMVNITALKL